jgi:uncharacterized phage protein (TIGR02220 family)
MDKTNFLLYKDFKPNVDILSDEQAGKLFKAIFAYVNGRIEPDFKGDGMLIMAFTTLKTQFERDLKKYKKQVEVNRKNGRKGGRPPKKEQETQSVNKKTSGLNGNRKNRTQPKKGDSDSVSDSVSDSDSDSDTKKDTIPYGEIIDYLNQKANRKFSKKAQKTRDLIKARFNEDRTLDDFKHVIDVKCQEWLGTGMEKYLRPETLFSNKFEGYVNQPMRGVDEEDEYAKELRKEAEARQRSV